MRASGYYEHQDNPYMRDALIDEMEQESVQRTLPGRRAQMQTAISNPLPEPADRAVAPVSSSPRVSSRPAGVRSSPVTTDENTGGGSIDVGVQGERVNPWDEPSSSKYAPRVIEENGQWYLTEHGNRRLLQPDEVEDAKKYQSDFWGQFPTGFQPGVGPQQNEDYLPPSSGSTGGGTAGGSLGASGATAGRYAGFDTQRAQDPSKSAKDAFLAAATASGYMPSTKDDAEAWFNEFIKAELEKAGYQVDWVEGDKAYVRTRENPGGETIDFLIDAGGDNPMIGWQSDAGDSGAAPTGTGAAAGGAAASSILGNDDVLDNINAQIQKLLSEGMTLEEIIALLTQGA